MFVQYIYLQIFKKFCNNGKYAWVENESRIVTGSSNPYDLYVLYFNPSLYKLTRSSPSMKGKQEIIRE